MPYRLCIDTSGNRLPAIFTVNMSLAANHGVNLRTAAGGRDFHSRHLAAPCDVPMPKEHEQRERGRSFVYRARYGIADFAVRGDATGAPGMSRQLLTRPEFPPPWPLGWTDPAAVRARRANEPPGLTSRRGFTAGTPLPPPIGRSPTCQHN